MDYALYIPEELDRIFSRLAKKDRKQLSIIKKKIDEVLDNPFHFKPLRGDMSGARRVHIGKSFVLVFEVDENDKAVRLLDYDHHDKIYQKK